jgi:hypothetical protein
MKYLLPIVAARDGQKEHRGLLGAMRRRNPVKITVDPYDSGVDLE